MTDEEWGKCYPGYEERIKKMKHDADGIPSDLRKEFPDVFGPAPAAQKKATAKKKTAAKAKKTK